MADRRSHHSGAVAAARRSAPRASFAFAGACPSPCPACRPRPRLAVVAACVWRRARAASTRAPKPRCARRSFASSARPSRTTSGSSGASLDGSRFERVRFVGRRIARAGAPVVDRLELDLQGVVVDRAAKALTAVADTPRRACSLKGADLAVPALQPWLAEPVRHASAARPNRHRRHAAHRRHRPGDRRRRRAAGPAGRRRRAAAPDDRSHSPRARRTPAAAAGHRRARDQSDLRRRRARPLPARLDAVEVGGDDTIRIAASGSRLPRQRLRLPALAGGGYSTATTIICTRSMPL